MDSKISVTSLAASSSGNAYYVKSGNTEILIDAGISTKRLTESLKFVGADVKNIKAVFVTHEHDDHVKGLCVLSKKFGIPIHMTKPSAEEYLRKVPDVQSVVVHELNYEYNIGGMLIKSFFSPHDSAACVGYTVETDDDKFGIATDMGYVDKAAVEALKDCVSVALESNYDEKKLMNGPYPDYLKARIRSSKGHLSNYDCAAFARFLAERGVKNFMLGHLSEENNAPEIAFDVSSRALKAFDGVTLKIAAHKEPTKFI